MSVRQNGVWRIIEVPLYEYLHLTYVHVFRNWCWGSEPSGGDWSLAVCLSESQIRWSEEPPSNYKRKIYILASRIVRWCWFLLLGFGVEIKPKSSQKLWILNSSAEVIFYLCRFSIYFGVLNLTSICFWQWVFHDGWMWVTVCSYSP